MSKRGKSGNPDADLIRAAEMMKAQSIADSASTLTLDGEKTSMADKAAAKKAQRRADAAAKKETKAVEKEDAPIDVAKALAEGTDRPALSEEQKMNAMARMATGVLASEKRAKDVKIVGFSLSLHSAILVEDTTIELNWGQRYGLIGRNGCGKSTFLQCLAAREVPIPEHIDTYLLAEEAKPSNMTALEYVISRCVLPSPWQSVCAATTLQKRERDGAAACVARPAGALWPVDLVPQDGAFTHSPLALPQPQFSTPRSRSAQKEYTRLEALGEHVLAEEGPDSEHLMAIYDRQVRAPRCCCAPPATRRVPPTDEHLLNAWLSDQTVVIAVITLIFY